MFQSKKLILFVLTACFFIQVSHLQEPEFEKLRKSRIDSLEYMKYDLKTLRLLRNSVFAFHGYSFKSTDLADYFSRFEWYEPLYSNVNDSLTDIEKLNVRTLKNIEDVLKNPSKYKKQYFLSIFELKGNVDYSGVIGETLEEYNYVFWNLEKPKDEYEAHTCYTVKGRMTAAGGYFIFYDTWDCPAASVGYSELYINIYDTEFNIKRKIFLFKTDGIFDKGSIEIKNDTISTTLEKYKGTYWDDYENPNQVEPVPYETVTNTYLIDFKNTDIKKIQ